MNATEQILKRAQRAARLVGERQGWDVFDTGGDRWVVQADDDAGLIDDNDAITLARRAGIDCDDEGRIRGLHPDAATPEMRTWDVSIQTLVAVEVPADVDPDTDEGVEVIKQAAKARFIAAIEEGSFDIGCEEYCGE